MKNIVISLIFIFITFNAQSQKKSYWETVAKSELNKVKKLSEKDIYLESYNVFRLDLNSLSKFLEDEFVRETNKYVLLEFPSMSGEMELFKIFKSSIMEPELQLRYTMIQTYKGVGVDDPTATIRFSITPLGFHALSNSGTRSSLYIEPYASDDKSLHFVFEKNSVIKSSDFECHIQTDAQRIAQNNSLMSSGPGDIDDQKLRKYRLALSCTGEYAQNFAGTGTEAQQKTNVLAAMVTSINRVNEIYERDLGIRLLLVANNDEVIFLNPNTDPWNNEYNTTTAQTLDNIIGVSNYDIGHNYNDSGGGNAGCLGCVCAAVSQNNFHKGRGWTGSNNPVGDPFYIDYVAHEMGHQFYGFHTMNRCSRSGYNTEVEPGSGSSIMGYAGICPPNVQNQSDAHFNYVNIRDIGGYIKTGYNAYNDITIAICEESQIIQNQPPTADAGIDYVIPTGTAFALTGFASDPDGTETLTYNWSQNDTEPAPGSGTPQSNWDEGPLYRSILPTTSPTRYFPKLETVVANGLSSTWEVTPNVPRTLNFAFTVRDNGSGFTGDDSTGQVATDLMTVEVIDTGSPFQVTSQSELDLTWSSGSTEIISWNVAGTDANGINTSAVDILLSVDSGENFDIVLAEGIPNNGNAEITVPDLPSLSCRLMVKGVNHIFYALNTTPFSIDYYFNTSCYTYNSEQNLNLPIPDGAGENEFGDFLVQYVQVAENVTISDVNFNIDITHAYIGDLNIILQHPDGTQVNLLNSDYCQDQVDLDITFDDEANLDVICDNPTQGTYRPTGEPLSAFDGKSSVGTWVLGVRDYFNQDAGILNDFSLTFCETELILGVGAFDLEQVYLYPNPVNDILYVNSNIDDLYITLYDLNGRELHKTTQKEIPMKNLSSGIYIIKMESKSQNIYKRIIKR